jgi:predicted RNase H-like nuclease (RuvC/YqgF family)
MDQVKNKAEPDTKQSMIADLEDALETLRANSQRIQVLEKNWGESEWYLGEARSRIQRLEDEIRDKDQQIRKLESEHQDHPSLEAALKESAARCFELEQEIERLKIETEIDG